MTGGGGGCSSYLLGAKKRFRYLLGCSALKGPKQELLWYWAENKIWQEMVVTSWYNISLAMGFRVWGWNSVKGNHSLLLDFTWIKHVSCISPSPTSLSRCTQSHAIVFVFIYGGGGGGLFKGEPDDMSNYLDRYKMASCLLEAWWFLDSKPDRNIPLWSEKWKRNILQNTRLQTNGSQSPKRDDDMKDWCVKTCQDREDYKFTNSQIPRLLRQ